MIRISNTKNAMNAAAGLVLRLLFVLVAFYFTRAEVHAQAVRVHFPVDQWVVKSDYLNNANALAAAEEIAQRCVEDKSLQVEILSYSSPEGNILYNQYLSENRSAALRDYLLARYPSLWGRVKINPYAEAWGDLREAVVSDERLSEESRAKLIAIIDKDIDSDDKEAELRKQPAFAQFYRNFFKYFRYAEVALKPATESAADEDAVTRYTVLFSLNSTDVDNAYAQNAQVLEDLDAALTGRNADRLTAIRVVSGSSIDGPVALNEKMSQLRGDAVKAYIESKYPKLSNLIVLESQGEAWDELRENVKDSDRLTATQKYEILKTIDDPTLSAQAKESVLRNSSAWNSLLNGVLPLIRFAAIIPVYEGGDVIAPALPDTLAHARDTMVRAHAHEDGTAVKATDSVAVVPQVDTLVPGPIAINTDTTAVAQVDTAAPAITDVKVYEEYTKIRKPLFAVTNNLLYESATIFTGFHSVPLNIGVEVPISQHWSVTAHYMATAPWRAWNSNADCAELLHADLGAKWYPGGTFTNPFKQKENRELLDGWYAYASLGAGYYDFERNGRGYQGEEILGSLGLGYGLTLGHNWSLDFAVGGGPVITRYRYYIGRSNNEHLVYQYSGRLTYFGVTDAKVSLRYLIHYNKKVKVQ